MELMVLRRKAGVVPGMEYVPVGARRNVEILAQDFSKGDLNNLKRDPDVAAIAPPMPLRLIEPFRAKTTQERSEWGIRAVGALRPGQLTGSGVTVAVLDTGIDASHPAFLGLKIVPQNFTSGRKSDVADTDGHGTHCAGIIFGRDVRGKRIGIARGVKHALIGKVLGPEGGSTLVLASAIHWAIEKGAHIISMSLGIDFIGFREDLVNSKRHPREATSIAMRALIDNVRFFDKLGSFAGSAAAFGRSALIIGASGNTSHRRRKRPIVLRAEFPSAAENFISAGAVEQTADVSCPFRVAEFSNAGANVCGPGVDILSAVPGEPRGRLESWSGTSMATPHVAGVATLWAHKLMLDEGPVSASTIAFNLLKHARRFQGLEQDDVGDGLVQSP